MNLHILCVGRLKEPFYQAAADEYAKRLRPYCKLAIREFPEERLPARPSRAQIDAALAREAAVLRNHTPPSSTRIALSIEGEMLSSEAFAQLLDTWARSAQKPVFFIGGSYGLDAAFQLETEKQISLSPMTFPHHLARVMLLEQLYRAFKIREGSSYHK